MVTRNVAEIGGGVKTFKFCPGCGHKIRGRKTNCLHCGLPSWAFPIPMPQKQRSKTGVKKETRCPSCGSMVFENLDFCYSCGVPLDKIKMNLKDRMKRAVIRSYETKYYMNLVDRKQRVLDVIGDYEAKYFNEPNCRPGKVIKAQYKYFKLLRELLGYKVRRGVDIALYDRYCEESCWAGGKHSLQTLEATYGHIPYLHNTLCSLRICHECFCLKGTVQLSGETITQTCCCSAKDESTWGKSLVKYRLGICSCCGLEIIPSILKLPDYCSYCRGMIIMLNHTVGQCLIRLGSLGYGVGVAGKARNIDAIVKNPNDLENRIASLRDQRNRILKKQMARLGISEESPVIELVRKTNKLNRKRMKEAVFYELLAFVIGKSVGETEQLYKKLLQGELQLEEVETIEEAKEPEPEPTSEYTSNREIRCAFFTLVIRNEALEEKYKGGLEAFVNKYLCEYNDDITKRIAMAADYLGPALDEIEESGLLSETDYLLFDASGHILCPEEDYTEAYLGVDWLKGYYLDSGTMVCYSKS